MASAAKLLIGRTLAVSIIFITVTLGSAVYVSLATVNYQHFYPAIDQLDCGVIKLIFVPATGSSEPRIVASIIANNPTDYSGLTIRQAYIEMYFFAQTNSSITLFNSLNRLNAYTVPPGQIPPNSVYSFDLTIKLNSAQAKDLVSFNTSHSPPGVSGFIKLRVDVSTFLVAATGSTVIDRVQNVTLTS